tara:strand:+ start:570 stop:2723 length:2154 start_codon:yes stop_codon:yes gene_type:complete
MCGIAGFFYNSSDYEVFNNNINSMLSNIAHRGPDNHGTYIDIKNMFAIGHRRLSILDLSDKGNQPMKSFKGNYTITYNGEAYNHNNLRNKLKTEFQFSNWKSNSDTETIVNYMEFYGVEKTIKDIDGMFSIGVWDRKKNRFILARDAFGEKPLYYGWGNKIFYFASEINALIGSIGFINEINPRAISSLMQYSYISAPNSIYNNIYKVKPGQLIEVRPGIQNTTEHEILNYCKISNWFNLKDEIEKTKNTKDNSLPIKNIIEETISSRLISDASLGCFLSGGVDSSLVASVISTISKTKYETFTIGFNEKEFDESRKAKIISDYLGLKSNILILNEKKMLNIVPKINDIYDEPFADSSQVPTFLLSQFASQFSKVSLSGDGGDELFGGYNRYYLTKNIWKFSSYIPFNIRNNFFNFVLNMPPSIFNNFEKIINYVLPDHRGLWIEERIDNKSLSKETIFGAILYNFLKFYEKITIKKSCKIVVLTENLKSKLISEYSISDSNIIVIPCYVDIDLFNKNISKNQIDLKNELRVPKNSKIICYLGSIGGFYLINEMLSFFLELKKKHHEYYLLIITRQIDEFKYLVKKLNNPLLDKSIFYKNLEYNEVPKYLMNVKFSIFFLKNSDARIGTCPIKFAESIALGVPVICNTGVGDLDRYFKENNIGAIIDLQKNSTKEFLINNIDKLENLSKKKIKKYALDNFSIKNAFYKYKLLYINHI